MAKKVLNDGELPSVFDTIKKIDDTAEIISESAYSNIKEWIPTGSYILNAAMSGDLFKAIPSGRIITFAGTSGTGKSYLACSCCREAQKMGYTPIYMDSEGAIDSNFVKRLGVDPENLIIKQVSTIAETSRFIANTLGALQQQEDEYGRHQKILFVLDSLGNLTSDKEMQDTKDGNNKRDMTKAQEIKAMFRVNATALARMQTSLIVVNHVYSAVGSYVPTNIQSGGSGIAYNSSLTIELSTSKLEDKDNDKVASQRQGSDTVVKTGVLVTAKSVKSRFCRPYKVKFQIPFWKKPNPYVGLEAFMTWENSGVVRGNLIDEKSYNKLTDAAKEKIHVFDYNGQTMYCEEKETARGIVVKHLGRQVPLTEFFTDTVFTQEFLEYLNKNVIHPMFDLPDQSAFDDIKEIEDSIETGSEIEK